MPTPTRAEEQPADTPLTHEQAIDSGDDTDSAAMPFWDHLTELRRCIVRTITVFMVATIIGLWFAPGLLATLMRPLHALPPPALPDTMLVLNADTNGAITAALSDGQPLTTESLATMVTDSVQLNVSGAPAPVIIGRAARTPSDLYFLSPVEPFMLLLQAALLLGCIAGIPAALWQAWVFVSPGLMPGERTMAKPALIWSCVLFPIGATFAWVTIGLALNVLLGFGSQIPGLQPNLVASQYVSFVLTMMGVSGLFFEFPLVMVLLSFLGILHSETLRARRRESIVGLAIVAAIFTPPDPFTMCSMLIPLLLLFELSIVLMRAVERRKQKAAEA